MENKKIYHTKIKILIMYTFPIIHSYNLINVKILTKRS